MSAAFKDDGPSAPRSTIRNGAVAVVCTYAATRWFSVGKVYPIVINEKSERCIRGSDGLLDVLDLVVSRFREASKEDLEKQSLTR